MRKRYLPTEASARKRVPLASGVLDYFPDALAAVAEVSVAGNEQHNPGKPLHWNRSKSQDFADTILRHLTERGTKDSDGLRHSAKLAWRALALLQVELEKELGLSLPLGATNGDDVTEEQRNNRDFTAARAVTPIPSVYSDPFRRGVRSGSEADRPTPGFPERLASIQGQSLSSGDGFGN